ncbi:MAG TPA: SUMF1/EgtB/PvdO family nonheme iron enzyme [Tepidisphaeraceae bacterium]|jgi:hypothetical protein
MTKFGQYQVVEVVSLTARGAVSTVQMPKRSGILFALKQLKSTQTEPDEPQWDSQLFLDRARVQKSVVAAGGKYWLPVRDMGATAEGAWIVTDYYPLTGQKLLEARMKLGAGELHHVIECVVKGLVELQQARGRAHGNLKPSNIIIEPGDLRQSSVFLTDPAQGTVHNEADDLYAIGEFIYQVVTRREFAGGDAWPVKDSSDWQALGKFGERWRELCSDLLSPDPGSRPRLADVSWLVRELAQRQRIRLPRKLWMAPVALACAGIVALAVIAGMTSTARRNIARSNQAWADEFSNAISNPQRRARFQNDPSLKAALVHLDAARSAEATLDSGLAASFNPLELARTRRAATELSAARDALSPERWSRLASMNALRQQSMSRGWTQPVKYLGDLAATVTAPGRGYVDAIDRILIVEPRLERQERQIDPVWRQLSNDTRQLEKTRDPALVAFARSLRRSSSRDVALSDQGFSGLESLSANASVASRLAKAVPADWPANVDANRFANDAASATNLSQPAASDMEWWLQNLPLYITRKGETSITAATLEKRLKEIDDIVAKSKPEAEDRATFDRARKQVAARIRAFAATPFIEKEFEEGLVASRQGALEADLQGLRRFARPETVKDLALNLPALGGTSEKVKAYWEQWKATELKDKGQGAERRSNLALLKSRSEELRSLLTTLDQELPPPPKNLPEEFAAVGRQHREEEIGKLLASIDPKAPRLDALKFATAAGSVSEWGRFLPKLAEDFPLRSSFVGPEVRPEEKWAGHELFFQDPLVQQIVKPDLVRLAALRRLAGSSRTELVDAARSSERAEVAFEAWRQLGAAPIQPAWPSGAQEVVAERDLRHRLEALLANVPAAERTRPLALFHEQGPTRWRGAVERARDEQTLAAAWQARDGFGIDASQMGALSASARFNLWLWRAHQELAGRDEVALRQSTDQLARASVELKDSSAAAVAVALNRKVTKPIFNSQLPGETVTVALAGTGQSIEFHRVEVPDGRPFYLATTEVSIGDFVSVVNATKSWNQCLQLPWPQQPGQLDVRRGPRVWEWTGTGQSARLTPPQLWMVSEEDNNFAPLLRAERFNRMTLKPEAGGMPSKSHPMQQVSAQTALWFASMCGCRLPTSREWLAAYEQFGKNVPPDQLNLRDVTWETERQYQATGKPSSSLLDDIFQDTTSPSQDARTRPINDGTLFFRPVDSSGGSVFHHLVGNVAEFLCEDSERFENLADAKSPQVISSFAGQSAGSLSVIGGSALSSPSIPVDRPQPLPRADRGFADVGFRLAISAPPRSLAEKVKWALRGQNYVWPNQNDGQAHASEVGLGR